MTDHFIEQLVGDLHPRKPLVNLNLWMHCTLCLLMAVGAILYFLGLRSDYQLAMQSGAMFWKPGIFFAAWLGSVWLITDISRPVGKVKRWHTTPYVIAAAIFICQFVLQTTRLSIDTMLHSLYDFSAIYCLSIIAGGSIMVMVIIWKYWLAKTASAHPTLLGVLAGINAGCLTATAYALHCDRDVTLYILVYYGLSILLLACIGGLSGRLLLRW